MNSIDELRKNLRQLHNEEEKNHIPEHVRLDLKPAAAGKDLLHDEHGMPRARGRKVPVPEVSQKPSGSVFVSPTTEQKITFGMIKRGIPSVGAQQQAWDVAGDVDAMKEDFSLDGFPSVMDDGFPSVMDDGFPSVMDDGFVDNNEFMDVDSIQRHRAWEAQKPSWQDSAEVLLSKYRMLSSDEDIAGFSKAFEATFGRGALKQFIQYVGKVESMEAQKVRGQKPQAAQQNVKPKQSNSMLNVKPRSYALVVAGNFVGEIDSADLLEKHIQDLVVNQGYNVEDIVVFQRKPVKFGVSVF